MERLRFTKGLRLPKRPCRTVREEVYLGAEMVRVYYADRRKVNQGRPDGWLERTAAKQHVEAGLATWIDETQKKKGIRLKRTRGELTPPAPSLAMAPWVIEAAADGDKRCIDLAEAWNEHQRTKAA